MRAWSAPSWGLAFPGGDTHSPSGIGLGRREAIGLLGEPLDDVHDGEEPALGRCMVSTWRRRYSLLRFTLENTEDEWSGLIFTPLRSSAHCKAPLRPMGLLSASLTSARLTKCESETNGPRCRTC